MAVQCSTGGTYLSSYPANNMPNTNTAITLMGWVNYSGWNTVATASMLGLYNGTATSSTTPTTAIQLGARTVAGQLYAWTWGGGTLVNTTAGSPTLTNGTWYHIAYTCTALATTQTHILYINGVQSAQATNSTQVSGALTQMYINGYPQISGGTRESSAVIVDSCAAYNRALSATEIQTIYNCRGIRHGITFGLIAQYLFSESSSGNISNCADYSVSKSLMTSGAGTALTYTGGTVFQNTRPQL